LDDIELSTKVTPHEEAMLEDADSSEDDYQEERAIVKRLSPMMDDDTYQASMRPTKRVAQDEDEGDSHHIQPRRIEMPQEKI
jgi:hypothetical protein